jgi:hypothetical protein
LNPFDWQISYEVGKFQEIAPEMPQPGYDKERQAYHWRKGYFTETRRLQRGLAQMVGWFETDFWRQQSLRYSTAVCGLLCRIR